MEEIEQTLNGTHVFDDNKVLHEQITRLTRERDDRESPSELGCYQDHLEALRNANDGSAITVYKDGGWKLWQTLDAKYAECEDEWFCTIPMGDIIKTAIGAIQHGKELE